MAICARLFTVWSLIPQPIHRSATPRLASGTTIHYGNLVNFSSFMGNPTRCLLFFVAPAFIALSSKSACLPACLPACPPARLPVAELLLNFSKAVHLMFLQHEARFWLSPFSLWN